MDEPYLDFLRNGIILEDKNEAKRFTMRAGRFVVYENKLYRRGYNMPLLKCVSKDEASIILSKIRERECRNHDRG